MAGYNSGWTNYASGGFSPSMLAVRCKEVIDALHRSGIRPSVPNRITRAIDIVTGLNDSERLAQASASDLHVGSEAFRTLWEFFFIGYTYRERGRPGGPFTTERLGAIFDGADTAATDANSRARSLQFELYTASALVLSGADVIDGEPDIRFLYHGEYRGVAVKRVQTLSRNAVRNAVRDGIRQIRGSCRTGFVALNLDTRVGDLDTAGDASALGKSFNTAVEDARETIEDYSDREVFLGAMLYGTHFEWIVDRTPPLLAFHMPRQVRCFTVTDDDVERARAFFEPAQVRLGNALTDICRLVSRSQANPR